MEHVSSPSPNLEIFTPYYLPTQPQSACKPQWSTKVQARSWSAVPSSITVHCETVSAGEIKGPGSAYHEILTLIIVQSTVLSSVKRSELSSDGCTTCSDAIVVHHLNSIFIKLCAVTVDWLSCGGKDSFRDLGSCSYGHSKHPK